MARRGAWLNGNYSIASLSKANMLETHSVYRGRQAKETPPTSTCTSPVFAVPHAAD